MSILIFALVLVVLILVHELGHFFAAKLTGMRVDEFGLGYPPRAKLLTTRGDTKYTLNWIPFGGFVRIFGEDSVGVDSEGNPTQKSRAFTEKSRIAQAFVLVAGITMNLILAWVLFTGALMVGTPRALSPSEVSQASNVRLVVGEVLHGSPASLAGITPGDFIIKASSGSAVWGGSNSKAFTDFVAKSDGSSLKLTVVHDGATRVITAKPEQHVISYDGSRYALGVGIAPVGILALPFFSAIKQGTALTWELTRSTAVGLAQFFVHAVTLTANLSEVSGPVGIASAVGTAATQGTGSLFSLVALISINLALINLIPIPALDGGRLLFVLIEAVSRKSIKPSVAQTINAIGFAFIVILMVVVTAHDIFRLVG
ncbi:MAG TPA: hypothetical protein ENJ75_00995 [Candidatus Kaiserbacteria bacterium]|nr:hypothetical protein [Candidatus Kaiserbacteria bacterium]